MRNDIFSILMQYAENISVGRILISGVESNHCLKHKVNFTMSRFFYQKKRVGWIFEEPVDLLLVGMVGIYLNTA